MPTSTALREKTFLSQWDIDPETGFLGLKEFVPRLPAPWDTWETVLDAATEGKLKLGSSDDLSNDDILRSQAWRDLVRNLATLKPPSQSKPLLRRTHLVLAFILHFYVHTHLPTSHISIPPSLSIPLLHVSRVLQMPPVLTYADTVLYNTISTGDNHLTSHTLFTLSISESSFYLTSARIDLAGVEALNIISTILLELELPSPSPSKLSALLTCLSHIIVGLKTLLLDVRQDCDPDEYYNLIRPWLSGEDSDDGGRKWTFEGIPTSELPTELSGPSAGQSSLIYALDLFLGTNTNATKFVDRMKLYMPHPHREFLNMLAGCRPSLREVVLNQNELDSDSGYSSASSEGDAVKGQARDSELLTAYNACVQSLKEFRDSHMIIATLYIIGPARRARQAKEEKARLSQGKTNEQTKVTSDEAGYGPIKGTGGTNLVQFLKGVRDRTKDAIID